MKIKKALIIDDNRLIVTEDPDRMQKALEDPKFAEHTPQDIYTMDKLPDRWELVYYPIFEDGKTGKQYAEPRALMRNMDKEGFWSKEVPLRYIDKL